MTDCTVAAPVRATKAPPNGKATPRPLSPATTSATTRPAVSEASRAASEALTYVSFLMCEIVENDDLTKEFEVSADLFRVADEQAAVLAYGDDEQLVEVGRQEIEALAAMIEVAIQSIDDAAKDSKIGAPMVVVTLAQHAQELLMRIADALEVSAATLGPLKKLSTYAGRRPHREQPRPPIRRVADAPEYQGPCKLTREQLVNVLEVAASNLATVDQLLVQAQGTEESWSHSILVDAARALVSHCGGMVDTAAGEAILGGHDRWNFGPNFARAGKAGAA